MDASTTPLLAASLGSIAALLGVLLGQVLQGRHEAKSWQRQAAEQRRRDAEQREDQRQRHYDLWRREDQLRLASDKRQLYIEGLAAGDQYFCALQRYWYAVDLTDAVDRERVYQEWLVAQTQCLKAHHA